MVFHRKRIISIENQYVSLVPPLNSCIQINKTNKNLLIEINKSMNIDGENIGDLISYSGISSASMSITPKNINNLSRGQTMDCKGVIHHQKLSISVGGVVNGSIGIMESYK